MSNEYDKRLFSGGLRERIHESRFRWLEQQTKGLHGSVLELGCFNARSLNYLSFQPTRYLGLDAGWEGGLDEAILKYPQFAFKASTNPNDIDGSWDIGLALETLEHLPRPMVLDNYLDKLAKHTRICIFTVPMEVGPLFAAKFIYKKYVFREPTKHTFREFMWQTFGKCNLVEQDNHRGFDYRQLINLIRKYFYVEKIEGVHASLPQLLNTQIGIVARSQHLNYS